MKRKEYYQIGRLLCVLGFLFLALEAFVNPFDWEDPYIYKELSTGDIQSLAAYWKVLIPAGFLVMGIAGRRLFDIYSAIAATLSSLFFLVAMGDEESFLAGVFGTVFDKFINVDEPSLIAAIILSVLWFGVIAIAGHRLLLVKKWKVPCVIIGILVLLIWIFYVAGFVGLLRESTNFYRMTDWACDKYGADFPHSFSLIVCKVMMVSAMVAAVLECVVDGLAKRAQRRENA